MIQYFGGAGRETSNQALYALYANPNCTHWKLIKQIIVTTNEINLCSMKDFRCTTD